MMGMTIVTVMRTRPRNVAHPQLSRPPRMHATCVLLLLFLAALGLLACRSESSIDIARIESRIRMLAELETAESVYRDIVYFGDARSFLFFRTMDRRLLFAVNLHVRAGIDLAEGFHLRPDGDGGVDVFMPSARVLIVDTDEQSIHQYFVREQGGRIGYLEFSGSIEEVKDRVASDAVARGLLSRAEENARVLVANLLTIAGVREVRFAGGQP
ncbi:MAG: DUF4230 domain-containing protein [Spirochaetaceae bacterium]|nr:MAG: DUF4230 domain-containing protein [Spirochaetaceae bacterium]